MSAAVFSSVSSATFFYMPFTFKKEPFVSFAGLSFALK